jgi:hypothetical protein
MMRLAGITTVYALMAAIAVAAPLSASQDEAPVAAEPEAPVADSEPAVAAP